MYLVGIMIALAVSLTVNGQEAEIQQCACSRLEPCEKKYTEAMRPCIDSCTEHLSDVQVKKDLVTVKECMKESESIIGKAFACFKHDYMKGCTHSPPKMVQPRFAEPLKMLTMAEIHAMVGKSGTMSQAGPLMEIANRTSSCVQKCMDGHAGECYKKMNCGLEMPKQAILTKSAKECMMRGGFKSVEMQTLCRCVSKNGIKSLAAACSRIPVA